MKKDIIIIAEIQNNKISPVTYEMASLAGDLADACVASVKIIVINERALHYAEEITSKSGLDVLAVRTTDNEYYNGGLCRKILSSLVNDLNPLYICVAHTSQGLDFGPGLAISLNAPCISGVSGYDSFGDELFFIRSVYGGKINANIKQLSEPAVLIIQPGIFRQSISKNEKGIISEYISEERETGSTTTGIIRRQGSDPAVLTTAKTVVAVGRGIDGPDNVIHAEKFSYHFSSAAIACSRPVVDLGWMKYKYQVGITGAAISPEIYIACGISGSTQHIAGMRGAELVISINSDPNASIFNVSDICIVDDMFDFFKAFEDIQKTLN